MSTLTAPRMLTWLVISVLLFIASTALQEHAPQSLLAVSIYKAHLLSLGGWAGYWLDRALFPYSRPHELIDTCNDIACHGSPLSANAHARDEWADVIDGQLSNAFDLAEKAMLRRALIVAACLIGMCLGA